MRDSLGDISDGDRLDFPPELEFLRRIWQLNHVLERLSRLMDRRLGVTAQQRMVIRLAGRFPGITAGQLARELHVDPGTISALLSRLEEKGLVVRRRDPRDVRRVLVGLTTQGHQLDCPTDGTVEHGVASLLAGLSPDAIARTQETLRCLVEHLEAEVTNARTSKVR